MYRYFPSGLDHARRLAGPDRADDIVRTGAQHGHPILADQVGAIRVAANAHPGDQPADLADRARAGDLVGASVDDVDHCPEVGAAAGDVGDGTVGAERDVADR